MAGRGDRFMYEREREQERDRYEDDRHYMAGGVGGPRDRSRPPPPPSTQPPFDDDLVRDRRYFEDEMRHEQRQDPRGRHVVMEKERDREYYRDSSRGRPAFLRRESSLDNYDRAPLHPFQQREEYPVPVRREDIRHDEHRLPPYTPIPLPKSRGLPPPRRHDERFYEDIHVTERDRYGDHHHHQPYTQEHIVEREIIREKEKDTRSRSRDSRSTHHRGRSRSSRKSRTSTRRSSSSRSSSSSSESRSKSSKRSHSKKKEYPRKGKTRIPAKLVSKRVLFELAYPFKEEGNFIIVQKALSQHNIDEILEMSEGYKKSDLEVLAARSSAGNIIEERIEERREEFFITAPTPPPAIVVPAPTPAVIIEASPGRYIEVEKSIYREASPSRSSTSDRSSHHHHHKHKHHHHHHSLGGEYELVKRHHSHSRTRSKTRSKSRSGRELSAEIRALEKEHTHRPRRDTGEREIIRTERLPNGELVVYEEKTERVVSGHKPPRLEKDKKGRMYISVPKR